MEIRSETKFPTKFPNLFPLDEPLYWETLIHNPYSLLTYFINVINQPVITPVTLSQDDPGRFTEISYMESLQVGV